MPMKLRLQRTALASALQIVAGVVPSKTSRDILKNIKLQVEEGRATLIGTDQEVGIRYELAEVETDSTGETLLPTQHVISVLRELSDESVDLDVTENAIWLRGAHSEFHLASSNPAEFPPVAEFDASVYFAVNAGEFRDQIRRTVFATDNESTRYALGGILLEPEGDHLTLAATDGRRLAVAKSGCRSEGGAELSGTAPVVPTKAMLLIERSITDEDDDLLISIRENDVLFKNGRSTVYSRLVEGRFPKYRDVLPHDFNAKVDVVAGPLYSVVRQSQIVTNTDSRSVDFNFADGMLTLSSQAADVGDSKVQMPISYDGEPIVIAFDPRYVAEFLRVLEAETQVTLNLIDSESAVLMSVGDSYSYVIMPLSRDG